MNKICLFIFILFTPLLKSQDKYMSLGFGGAIPQSNLAADDDIFADGYASTGFLAEYSGVFFPKKHVGIGVSFQFISNFTDQEKMKDELLAIVPESVPSDAPFAADIGKWDIISLTAGPEATYQFGIIHVDLYLKTGLYVVSPPPMKLTAEISDNESYYCSLDAKYARPGFNTGINLRLDMNEYTGLRLFAEYEQTNTKGVIREKYISSDTETRNFDYSTRVSLLNFGIGLIYRL